MQRTRAGWCAAPAGSRFRCHCVIDQTFPHRPHVPAATGFRHSARPSAPEGRPSASRPDGHDGMAQRRGSSRSVIVTE